MKYKKLLIAQSEIFFIKDLMKRVGSKDEVNTACYKKLREELETAEAVTDRDMPIDVVRLNSHIDIKTPRGVEEGYQLVVPRNADAKAKRLSILTPMGSALIGYAEGDEIVWNFPSGEQTIKIMKVY